MKSVAAQILSAKRSQSDVNSGHILSQVVGGPELFTLKEQAMLDQGIDPFEEKARQDASATVASQTAQPFAEVSTNDMVELLKIRKQLRNASASAPLGGPQ
jgi:hypothetical protein